MKCDQCDSEATVHEVTIRGGAKVERHLCQSCAAGAGIVPGDAISPMDVLQLAMEAAGAADDAASLDESVRAAANKRAPKPASCGTCGMTWEDFKTGGMLGCPNCYEDFETKLIPLIERAHEGASQHVGKIPARAGGQAAGSRTRAIAALVEERAQRLSALRRLLDDSVKAEQYERAAQLRDELRRLSDAPAIEPPGSSS
jgi:protein arginine kinase activator